jgi:hypothetical protein
MRDGDDDKWYNPPRPSPWLETEEIHLSAEKDPTALVAPEDPPSPHRRHR